MSQEQAHKRSEPVITRLARLSRSDMPPDEFLKTFLAIIHAALAAEGASIWLYSAETRQLAPKAVFVPESGPIKDIPEDVLPKIVYKSLEQKLPILYVGDDTPDTPSLRGITLMCVPLEIDEKLTAVTVLSRVAREGNAFTPENVHILQSLGAHLALYFTSMQWKASVAMSARLAKLAEIEADLAAASDREKMSFVLANRLRELLEIDRIFVAVPRRSSWRVDSISGLDDIQQKTASVRTLSHLAREFARIQGDWHFTPQYLEKVEDASLQEALTVYFESTEYHSLLLLRVEDDKSILAVIGIERRAESSYSPQDMQLLQAIAKLAAKPVRRAVDFQNLFGIKTIHRIERLRQKAIGPKRHRFFLKIALSLAVAAVLIFGRMQLVVRGDCRIQPILTTLAAARIPGTIREILKNENDAVKKGDVLARLDDQQILNAIRAAQAEMQKTQASIDYYASTNDPRRNIEIQNLKILEIELAGLNLQKDMTDIVSAQDGIIITRRDRINAFLDASVQRGQPLCEVADLSKVYVEVEIAERDIALVKPGQKIEFALTGSPGEVFTGTISRVSPTTQQIYGKNVFVARAELDNKTGSFRPGLNGTAAIPVGGRPLVYVIFRSTIDYVHSKFL